MKLLGVLFLNLFVVGAACALDLKWDVGADPNSQVGDGFWNTTNTHWWDSVSETNVNWAFGDTAKFGAGDGSLYTITLNEDIDLEQAVFDSDANCLLTGVNSMKLYGKYGDPQPAAVITGEGSSVRVNNDLYRHESTDLGYGDPEFRVTGQGTKLTLNGDIFMTDYSGTEDFVFSREDTSVDYDDYAEIEVNGSIFNNTVDGKIIIKGWNGSQLAGTRLVMNGDMHTYGNELRLQPGAWLTVGGRIEANLINMVPRDSVENHDQMPSIIEGAADNSGIWSVTTAGYNGSTYLKRNATKTYSKIYAVHLNLEVDVDGLDFNDPGKNYYQLTQSSVRMRWFGSLNSYYAKEPAGMVGTVITMVDMPAPGESSTQPVYFAVETTDFDQSGCVDYADFAFWSSEWGTACNVDNDWCSGRDLDHNGSVDPNDMSLIATNWLVGCSQ